MMRPSFLLLAAIVVLLGSPAFGQRAELSDKSEFLQTRLADKVADLQKNLKDARRLLADIDDKKLRERLELLLSRASLQADDLEELMGSVPRRRAARPISAEEHEKLLKNIKEQAFDEQRVEFIVTFVKDRPITCEQATQILKLVVFDEGRTKAAIALHPSVIDPENFFEVLKVFPFESSRESVMKAVKKNNEK
jgi:hypothetical protein